MFLIGVPVMALWGLAGPALQALMTRRVGPSEQGQLQGATASLQAIAGLIGPGIFTQTFAVVHRAAGRPADARGAVLRGGTASRRELRCRLARDGEVKFTGQKDAEGQGEEESLEALAPSCELCVRLLPSSVFRTGGEAFCTQTSAR